MTLKLLHLWCHSQKTRTPRQKFFSSAIYLTGQSVWAIEQLSSTIGGGARALVRQPKTAVFFCENRQNHPDAKVLMLSTCGTNRLVMTAKLTPGLRCHIFVMSWISHAWEYSKFNASVIQYSVVGLVMYVCCFLYAYEQMQCNSTVIICEATRKLCVMWKISIAWAFLNASPT